MRISNLFKRKGGGGKGGGGGGGGKSSGGSGAKGSAGSTVPVTGSVAGGRSSATAYGAGGGRPVTIPGGQPFAGRVAGGGTRGQVYGNSFYGSGYPGVASRGVGGLPLPFFFWPLAFGGGAIGTASYLHDTDEYGKPDNSSRPGGPMTQAQFQSSTTNTTFHVLADNSTVTSLIGSITANCSSEINAANTSTLPVAYTSSATDPQPEQAVQFYRASSVALTLDGYNDTAALSNDTNAPPTPLPSGIDTVLLVCLNDTIGQSVPLIDAGMRMGVNQAGSTFAVAAVMAYLLF